MQLDLMIKFQEVLDVLDKEGIREITIGTLAVRIADRLPNRNIQTAFHAIHRFGHKMSGWCMLRNEKHVQVLRRA